MVVFSRVGTRKQMAPARDVIVRSQIIGRPVAAARPTKLALWALLAACRAS
jgi:hypothetical protein